MTSDMPSHDPGRPRAASDLPEHLEVLIVGAGISGIGAAYRISESLPLIDYAILEARDASGGTWDLFRYPGVRSDSDMFTLSYPFRPWLGQRAIAHGEEILDYIRETARRNRIEEKIHYGCKVTGAAWSTPDQRWRVTIATTGADGSFSERVITANHVHLAAGYYDYEQGHQPEFPGSEDFSGQLIHPQFWPDDLDHAGKRVVIIGSGATAVTLVPAMAETAASVTMLQRTPSYVFAVPGRDPMINQLREWLPKKLVHRMARAKFIGIQGLFYKLSRRAPGTAKQIVMRQLRTQLPDSMIEEHFTPPYGVWDQRLCAVPDGDLFAAIRSGRAGVVTGGIDRFVENGILLNDGRLVEADIVVSATGLRLKALGGVDFSVDGTPYSLREAFAYRGAMLAGLPNLTMSVGYVNASWTLRADLISRYLVALLTHLRDTDQGVAVPIAPEGMTAGPILDLASGYIRRSIGAFPKVGDREPWTMPQSYLQDAQAFRSADLTRDMFFIPRGDRNQALPPSAKAPAELELPDPEPAAPTPEPLNV